MALMMFFFIPIVMDRVRGLGLVLFVFDTVFYWEPFPFAEGLYGMIIFIYIFGWKKTTLCIKLS